MRLKTSGGEPSRTLLERGGGAGGRSSACDGLGLEGTAEEVVCDDEKVVEKENADGREPVQVVGFVFKTETISNISVIGGSSWLR